MTDSTVVIQPESDTDESVALAAGTALATAENAEEHATEAEDRAEIATEVAESAASVAYATAEEVAGVREMVATVLSNQNGIIEMLGVLAQGIDGLRETVEDTAIEPEPEPEQPKPDSKPKRKSAAHRILYGG